MARTTHRERRRGAGGFTLLELLVVMALLALVMAASVRGLRSMARSDLRASAGKIAGAMRYLFDRASTTGRVHRLVLDLSGKRYWAEVSDDRYYLPRELEDEASRERGRAELEIEREQENERRANLRTDGRGAAYDLSGYTPQEFKPKRARFSAFKDVGAKVFELPRGVRLMGVYTPRLAEPVAEGQEYVYFFPLGQTEAAIVHLSDEGGETIYSLVAHPLTGRVRIERGYVAPPIERLDDEGREVLP